MSVKNGEITEYVKYAISEGATALANEGISDEDHLECPPDLLDAIDAAAQALGELDILLKVYEATIEEAGT